MGKSKTRKNRRLGPAPKVQDIAAKRASKNFVAMISKRATEGHQHRLTLELAEGKTSTLVDTSGSKPLIADTTVTDLLLTCLAMGKEFGVALETLSDEGQRYVRVWVAYNDHLTPMTADEVRGALKNVESSDEQAASWLTDGAVVISDAYSLTSV